MKIDDKFSQRLLERMSEMRLTQVMLAQRTSAGQSSISRWLSGAKPQARILAELARVLNVSPEWLATGMEPTARAGQQLNHAIQHAQQTLGIAEPSPTYGASPRMLDSTLDQVRAWLEQIPLATTPAARDQAVTKAHDQITNWAEWCDLKFPLQP